ncbi:MAG TPA: hypothetical protein VM182_05785 [Terriglobia bacterium]|nr:hypothetical protein [Terriglobia bacterium]
MALGAVFGLLVGIGALVKGLLQDAAVMGRNKQIRKKIEGHQTMVLEHHAKIQKELRASNPREALIAYWERRIRQVEQEILRLEERLRRH